MKDIFETNGLKGVRYLKEGQLVTQDIAKNLIETAQVADFLTSENHNEPYTTFRSNLASTVMRLNATTAMAILPPVLEEFKRGEHIDQTLFAGQSFPLDTENDFSYPQWVVTGKDERNNVIRLLSGGNGIIGHGYPGYVFEVAGQKLGQVRNPPKNMEREIGESYFCAVQDNACSALINMIEKVDIVNGVEEEAWDNGYHYIKKGQSKVFGSKTVECLSEDIVASKGCDSTFRKAKYRITENGVSKEIDYIGFRKFDDNELDIKFFTRLKNGNVQEQQDAALQIAAHNNLLKAQSELVIKAIDYLDEQHALDGRVMTNCKEGQNRSNFMNTAIAYRKAIHNQIDAIVQAYPGDLARQNQEIAKLQTFLKTEVAHDTSPGYTNAHVLAEGLRAQIELNARISSKQRDQVLAFATHQTAHIIEHYVEKVRAQGLEETKADDKAATLAQDAGLPRAASPVRAASPTPDGGRAAGAPSPGAAVASQPTSGPHSIFVDNQIGDIANDICGYASKEGFFYQDNPFKTDHAVVYHQFHETIKTKVTSMHTDVAIPMPVGLDDLINPSNPTVPDDICVGNRAYSIDVLQAGPALTFVGVSKEDNPNLIKLNGGNEQVKDHSYPGYIYEVAGHKMGQVRLPAINMANKAVGEGYFMALIENDAGVIINMVDDQGWGNEGYHALKKGESFVVEDGQGNTYTVSCNQDSQEIAKETLASGKEIKLKRNQYVIFKNGSLFKEVEYIGFEGFNDDALTADGNSAEYQQMFRAKDRIMMKAIETLNEKGKLDSLIMTNCNAGQNRSNFANVAIAYYNAINKQIDKIVNDFPEDFDRQIKEVQKLHDFLRAEVSPDSHGYTNRDLLIESLRTHTELNSRVTSSQRAQTLYFAAHQTGRMFTKRLLKIREQQLSARLSLDEDHTAAGVVTLTAQGISVRGAADVGSMTAIAYSPASSRSAQAASPVRESPTPDGGRAAGAASPTSPRVTPVNEAVNLMLIALRDGNPTKEDLLGIVNLMPPEEQEGIRVLVEHSPQESLISNLERTARQSPSSPQTRSPSPSDTKSVANEEVEMERTSIQHVYNRFYGSKFFNSGADAQEERNAYLEGIINQASLSGERKNELMIHLGAMETGREVVDCFIQLGAVQRERTPFEATFRPVSKDQEEGVSGNYRSLIESMQDQASLLAAELITKEQFKIALKGLLQSHSALITPEEKKGLESLLKHKESNELVGIIYKELGEIKRLAATHRAVRDLHDMTEDRRGYAAGYGPSPSSSRSSSPSSSSGRNNGSGGCSIQ